MAKRCHPVSGPKGTGLLRCSRRTWTPRRRSSGPIAASSVTTIGELEQHRHGPRRGLHHIVELLDEFGAKGSFYVPSAVMETCPRIVPGPLAKGHEVGLTP